VRFLRHFGELSVNEAVDPGYLRPGFPEIIIISNIVDHGQRIGAAADVKGLDWHTDYCWQERVSVVGALEAVEIPPEGGATSFVNMYAVYEALEPELRERVDGLRASHEIAGTEVSEARAEHPLVATNPVSGRRALYLNSHFTKRLIGMDAEEGDTLLRRLVNFSISPQFTYEHKWQLADLVLWDQIGLIHARMPYGERERRYMRQITVLAKDAGAPWRSVTLNRS
jgi:pentalenolactone F synthase